MQAISSKSRWFRPLSTCNVSKCLHNITADFTKEHSSEYSYSGGLRKVFVGEVEYSYS